jgi:hypothetical protein
MGLPLGSACAGNWRLGSLIGGIDCLSVSALPKREHVVSRQRTFRGVAKGVTLEGLEEFPRPIRYLRRSSSPTRGAISH